jgi:hypothetical protein
MAAAGPRLGVFVSYSHADDPAWLERVQVHLKPLVRAGRVGLWDDTRIKSGERWREEVRKALARAKVAVLLISADFYASDFIADNELPPLLEAERERGLVILGVHINHSRFDRDRVLSEYQTINPPHEPIEGLSKTEQEEVFDALARRIEELLDSRSSHRRPSWHGARAQTIPERLHDLTARRWQGVPGAMVAVILLGIVGALALVVGSVIVGDDIDANCSSVNTGTVSDAQISVECTDAQPAR